MSRIKKLLRSVGLIKYPAPEKPHDYKTGDYQNGDKEKLVIHKAYLKDIEGEESNRLNSIENKTSQIISQTGLIFSLLSLFIPFIIDKILDLGIIPKIVFILFLSLAYLSYIITISNALKNFNVRKFNYIKNSPVSVLSKQQKSVEKFMRMEIRDSLSAINNNIAVNNAKATNLINAYHSFKLGNIFTSVLVVFLCISLLFIETTPTEVNISKPIKIENLKDLGDETIKRDRNSESILDSVRNTTAKKGSLRISKNIILKNKKKNE